MKKELLPIALFFLLVTVGCKKETPDSPPNLSENRIRFDQLAIGQKSRYVRFRAGSCIGPNNDFVYLSDTLLLEVVDNQSNVFTLKESFTANSLSILYPDSTDAWFDASEIEIKLFFEQDTAKVVIPPTPHPISNVSRIFSILPLPLAEDNLSIQTIATWFPDEDGKGYVKNYQQLGNNYPRLNFVANYYPMFGDGPGDFYLYKTDYGIVRSGSRNGWCPDDGTGWDLLSD